MAYRSLDTKTSTTMARVTMTHGLPPATATTMIVIMPTISDTPVIGGTSPSFWVVFRIGFLVVLLLGFPLLTGSCRWSSCWSCCCC